MRLILTLILIAPLTAWSHARLRSDGSIPPRTNNAGIKNGPCGGIARTVTPTVLQRGSTITVTWEETVNHPGRFEFYFSPANDANWVFLKSVVDNQNDTNLPHQFSTTLTLPNQDCAACTIQMIQVMTETNPASLYYSCADIVLQGGAGQPPSPNPDPGVTSESCH